MFISVPLLRYVLTALITALLIVSAAPISAHTELTDTIEDETPLEGEEPIPPKLTREQEEDLSQIKEPDLTNEETQLVLKKYKYVDPKWLISRSLLNKALVYYDTNKEHLPNPRYLTVINFSLHSSRPRMFIITMATGAVLPLHMSHGTGSDPKSTGYASYFGNVPRSNRSSLGFYRTAETYFGKHGYSLRMDGLSETNSNARSRAIVIHGAQYVKDKNVKQGRSWGCPAVSLANRVKVVDMLKEGSLIYAGLVPKKKVNDSDYDSSF